MTKGVVALALVLSACGSHDPAPASPPPAPGPAPTVTPPMPAPSYPVGAIALDCVVSAEIEPVIRTGGEVTLRFSLKNHHPRPVEVTLQGTCPGGFVEVVGLPANFDPMHTCQAGACAQPTLMKTFTIAAGGSTPIGETRLPAQGNACNPPLPLGTMLLHARVNLTGGAPFAVCSGAQVHIERDHKSGALRLAGPVDDEDNRLPPQPTTAPSPKPTPTKAPAPKQAPKVAPTPRQNCPACGVGCPNGRPLTGLGPDGCPRCGCEKHDILAPSRP